VECPSLWGLCEGNLEGHPCWGPLEVSRKGSGDGHISFNRGSDWGTWRRTRIPGTFERGGLPCLGPLGVGRKCLEIGISPMGAQVLQMGKLERAHLPGTLRCGRKGL
jgi:hypothetical protein